MPDERDPTPVEPAETPDPAPETEHRDDGLDLARALTRASSRVGPKKRSRKASGRVEADRARPRLRRAP